MGEFPLLLAPMEDVSDPPFRFVCKKYGADLMFTEFISSEGLVRNAKKSLRKLDIFDYERPIGIQFFGGDEEVMCRSVEIIEANHPDLVDINYGCPVHNVVNKCAGAGILKDLPKMVRLTEAIVKSTQLPVTVKTRLGWDDKTKNVVEVAERLQDIGIQAITIHGRTRTQMYKGEADWSLIAEVKNNPRMKIPVFGNGDADSSQRVKLNKEKYGVDGIMIGRAAIGNPWIFNEIKHFLKTDEMLPPPTNEQRVFACRQHLQKSMEWKGERLGVLEMRRHYTNYFRGIPNSKQFRNQLVLIDKLEEIEEVFRQILQLENIQQDFLVNA